MRLQVVKAKSKVEAGVMYELELKLKQDQADVKLVKVALSNDGRRLMRALTEPCAACTARVIAHMSVQGVMLAAPDVGSALAGKGHTGYWQPLHHGPSRVSGLS